MISNLRNYSKIIIIIIAVAMVVTGGLYGYGRFLNQPSTGSNAPSPYIAKVNGTNITQQDYYSVLRNQSAGITNFTRSQEVPFKLQVLNTMINRELLLQKAQDMGLKPDVSDEDVDNYVNDILENNDMTMGELENYLKEQKSTLKQLKRDLREGLKKNELIKQVREKSYDNVTVSEEEIINSYEKVHPQVIVKYFGDEKEKARSKIEEAMEKLKNGANFGDIAREYSDLAASNKGDLGMIGHDNNYLPDSVTDQAFEMEKNKRSSIIEGEKAFYIIKVLDIKLAEGEDFKEVKKGIKEDILQKKQDRAFTSWLENLRAESDIVIEDPLLAGFKAKENGDFETAIAELKNAMESYPIPMTYIYLAQSYKENNQLDKAIETFKTAIEQYPEDWELHYNYAMIMANQEQPDQEKAISLLDKAAKFAEDDLMAHYQIYMGYTQLGAEDKAKAEMERVTEIQAELQKQQEELQKTKTEAENDENKNAEQADVNSEDTSDRVDKEE